MIYAFHCEMEPIPPFKSKDKSTQKPFQIQSKTKSIPLGSRNQSHLCFFPPALNPERLSLRCPHARRGYSSGGSTVVSAHPQAMALGIVAQMITVRVKLHYYQKVLTLTNLIFIIKIYNPISSKPILLKPPSKSIPPSIHLAHSQLQSTRGRKYSLRPTAAAPCTHSGKGSGAFKSNKNLGSVGGRAIYVFYLYISI